MRNFIITTDSNADLPPSYAKSNSIPIIPQYYAFGETVYGDEQHLPVSEFYAQMRNGALPTSMANNPAVIRSHFEEKLKEGFDILHIAFSSALSGSYNNVMVTARELMETYPTARIEVVDSLNVSLGEALLVLKAVDMKNEGHTLAETFQTLEEEKHHLHVQFTVDDLHHLQRGGRVSKATALIGSMIHIKPLLCIDTEGKLVSHSTVRGRKKSLATLVDNMRHLTEIQFDKARPVGIIHGDCIEDAHFLAAQVKEKLGCTNVVISDISPSIGAHAGPGTLGLCFYGKMKE